MIWRSSSEHRQGGGGQPVVSHRSLQGGPGADRNGGQRPVGLQRANGEVQHFLRDRGFSSSFRLVGGSCAPGGASCRAPVLSTRRWPRGWGGGAGVGRLRWPLTASSGASAGLAVLTRSVKNLASCGVSRGGGASLRKAAAFAALVQGAGADLLTAIERFALPALGRTAERRPTGRILRRR